MKVFMPKLAICSDLHLEFQDIELKNTENANVLILSGDIMVAQDLHEHPYVDTIVNIPNLGYRQQKAQGYRDFLKRVSEEFPHVIYIPGNHEFYHGYWYKSIKHLCDECANFSNVYFMERNTKVIDDVTFIGATLWTDCNNSDPLTMTSLESMMNDYSVIRNDQRNYGKLRTIDTLNRHIETVTYIKHRLSENTDKKVVVVGHHAPTTNSVHQRYQHNTHRQMNGGYASDLSELILDNPQIKLWTLGHMHDPHSYYMGDTFVVCNPRGYAGHDESSESFKLRFIDLDNLPAKFDGVNWSRD